MSKFLLAGFVLLVFVSNAQAYEYYYDDFGISYVGTPNYPDNYGDTPAIFQGVAGIDFYDFSLADRYGYTIEEPSIFGAEFFYKGRKVGEVQNVEASSFPNILFTEARFFVSDPGLARYYYSACPEDDCPLVGAYTDSYAYLDNVTYTYWDYTTHPVPEPKSYAMMLVGIALLGTMGRYKRKF